MQVIVPKVKGFICTTTHPVGCKQNVDDQIKVAEATIKPITKYQRALILGASSGFGLASRIALTAGGASKTIGVYFERNPKEGKTGSPGYYNSKALAEYAKKKGIYSFDFDADGFSDQTRTSVASKIAEDLGQIDLLIYSLAAPRRTDPQTNTVYSSVLKPIGNTYSSRTVDLMKDDIKQVKIEPASAEEVENTVKVMGGEDWQLWIEFLQSQNLLADNFKTVAFSYIGSELTYPIYRDGTIGQAKAHLEATVEKLNKLLAPIHGNAIVSVNKALVTQASSAIPVVPLYLSLLYKVMKDKNVHEDCIMQMVRLFNDYLSKEWSDMKLDESGRIRLDDLELREDVQHEVLKLWDQVTTENLNSISDIAGVRSDYLKVFGFDNFQVDYKQPVDIAI